MIHGMGSQGKGYSLDFQEEMTDRLVDAHGISVDKFAWGEVFWADIIEEKQRQYFQNMDDHTPIDFLFLRKFMLTAFADAAAYQRIPGRPPTIYNKIHERITLTITDLNHEDNPLLIVFAHSLGGHIITNYIYDMNKCLGDAAGNNCNVVLADVDNDFQQLKTLCGIVTFGCNIPLFTFALEEASPVPFRGGSLDANQKNIAQWLNFYDRDDILGYPLRPINQNYRDGVTADIEVNVGGIASSWNPASHIKYWTDNSFTRPAAEYVAKVIAVA